MPDKKYITCILAWLAICTGIALPTQASAATPDQLQAILSAPTGVCSRLASLRTADIDKTLLELYQRSGFASQWQSSAQLAALQHQLAQLSDDGLIPADYGYGLSAKPSANPCDELRVSSEYLLALEHLSLGRLPQARFANSWRDATSVPDEPQSNLVDLAMTGLQDMPAAFDAARPALQIYRELRLLYRGMNKQPVEQPVIATGNTIRPGEADPRISGIVRRLQAEAYLTSAGGPGNETRAQRYEPTIVQAVMAFQADHGLEVDGLIGAQTVAALNVSPQQRLQQVRINLERLRWLNNDKREYMLLVNIAGGDIRLYRSSEIVWQSKVMSGRPERPTPDLISRLNRITLNPSWTVPPTIFKEDKLPQIRRNDNFLQQNNLLVLNNQGQAVDPSQVDWSNPVGIMLRQPPGPTNPLGKIAFRFPSPFSVYLHDTPSQNLFEKSARNVSSGCVRVQDAAGLAAHLLAGKSDDEQKEIALLQNSGETQEITLPDGPQLVIAYWTAEASGNGKVKYLPDPYDRDQALMSAFRDLDGTPKILAHQVSAAAVDLCSG